MVTKKNLGDIVHDVMNHLAVSSGQMKVLDLKAKKNLTEEQWLELHSHTKKAAEALEKAVSLVRSMAE